MEEKRCSTSDLVKEPININNLDFTLESNERESYIEFSPGSDAAEVKKYLSSCLVQLLHNDSPALFVLHENIINNKIRMSPLKALNAEHGRQLLVKIMNTLWAIERSVSFIPQLEQTTTAANEKPVPVSRKHPRFEFEKNALSQQPQLKKRRKDTQVTPIQHNQLNLNENRRVPDKRMAIETLINNDEESISSPSDLDYLDVSCDAADKMEPYLRTNRFFSAPTSLAKTDEIPMSRFSSMKNS